MRTLLLLITVVLLTARPVCAAPPEVRERVQAAIPLDDGRLVAGDLVAALAGTDDLPPGHPLRRLVERLTWTIDLRSDGGRRQLESVNRLTGQALVVDVQGDHLLVTMPADAIERFRVEAQRRAGYWWDQLGRSSPSANRPPLGLSSIQPGGRHVPFADLREVPTRAVVLVHGLDEPGRIWNDLIPALLDAGHDVMRFEYPNDGAIIEAADLLAHQFAGLRRLGVTHVDIVAHSMGGLVSRDLLTRPAYYAGDGALSDRLPAVDRLIMLGTPNHGSEMARLRRVNELRERAVRLFNGHGLNLDGARDGDGEAGIDLLPESDFLRRLNSRPNPTHTRYTIIAGRWIPVEPTDVGDLVDQARELAKSPSAPAWLKKWVDGRGERLESLLNGAVTGLGDGVVTLTSARLEGVDDFVEVGANHMTMVHNPLPVGATPPAIPLVLERVAGP